MDRDSAIKTIIHFSKVDQDLERRVAIESTDQLASHMRRWIAAGVAADTVEVATELLKEADDNDEAISLHDAYAEAADRVIRFVERKVITMASDPESSTSPTSNLHDRYELAAWAEFLRGGFFSSDVAGAIKALAMVV